MRLRFPMGCRSLETAFEKRKVAPEFSGEESPNATGRNAV